MNNQESNGQPGEAAAGSVPLLALKSQPAARSHGVGNGWKEGFTQHRNSDSALCETTSGVLTLVQCFLPTWLRKEAVGAAGAVLTALGTQR